MKRRRYRLSKTARRVLRWGMTPEPFVHAVIYIDGATFRRRLDLTLRSLHRGGLIDDGYFITPAGRRALARGWR